MFHLTAAAHREGSRPPRPLLTEVAFMWTLFGWLAYCTWLGLVLSARDRRE